MRAMIIGAFVVAVLISELWEPSSAFSQGQSLGALVAIYDPNPSHLWNRLHAVLFTREDLPDTKSMPDALDPPLWHNTRYLLEGSSHERILGILDEFLQTHAERLIGDPVKRAILVRDLWAVFDWSVQRYPLGRGEPTYAKEKLELQSRLAEVMRRLALSSEEIHSLPGNYSLAVASGQFAKEYDPSDRNRPFLPPDLLELRGTWVQIFGRGGTEPVAAAHSFEFSRSSFLVFMRLPGGRKATFDYIRALWDFPQPWTPRTDGPETQDQAAANPQLPQFPAGTQFALVRQMMLFDNHGNLEVTPITESVQIRTYHKIPISIDRATAFNNAVEASGQDFYEIKLSRPQIFANKAGGLRATGRKEREFAIFSAPGPDVGSPSHSEPLDNYRPILEDCAPCHLSPGINSVNSREHLLRPNWLEHEFPAGAYDQQNVREYDQNIGWKHNRYDWGLLNGYWNSTNRK